MQSCQMDFLSITAVFGPGDVTEDQNREFLQKEQLTQCRQSPTNPLLKWSSDRYVGERRGGGLGIVLQTGQCDILRIFRFRAPSRTQQWRNNAQLLFPPSASRVDATMKAVLPTLQEQAPSCRWDVCDCTIDAHSIFIPTPFTVYSQ